MRMIIQPLLLITGLMLLSLSAKAEDSPRRMVITGLEAPPYVILGEQDNVSGILVELIQQALEPIGIQPVFKISNWPRAFETVKNGHADAIIPTIKSADREEYFVFPNEPLIILKMVLLKNSSRSIDFNGDVRELDHLRIGKIRKARVAPDFDTAVASGKLLLVEERTTFGLLALGVARGRLDLMAGDELMSLWGAAANGVIKDIEPIEPHLAKVPVYLAISKQSPYSTKIEQISEALAATKQDLVFKQSLESYEQLLRIKIINNLMNSPQK
ncbi:MAG: substrate-binding periplasmic protein [Neptuniibacter sp.]